MGHHHPNGDENGTGTWAEQSPRASELKNRRLFEAAQDGILILDADTGRINDVNPFLIKLLGLSHDEMVGKTVGELSPFKDIVSNQIMLERLQRNSYIRYEDLPLETRDGRKIAVEFVSNVYQAGDKTVIQCNIRDITARKKAEATQTLLATAIEQAAEIIVITDVHGTIQYVNPAFERISGYIREEVIDQTPRILKSGKHDAAFYRQMWGVLKSGQKWNGHFVNRRKDGTIYEEDATISPVRDAAGKIVNYVAVKRDVTREMQLEAKFLQAQKMEAIGQLAGGVAHDFNNILAASLMQLSLLQEDPHLTPELRSALKDLEDGSNRAASLTRQLLLFSRRQAMEIKPLEFNALFAGLVKMLRRLLGEQIDLIIHGQPEPAWVDADAGMMEQVVTNLCINARDAMPDGGQITIGTSNIEFDEAAAKAHAEARPGKFAFLSVADTGCGMNEAILDKIFEPFFTTKEAGKGTGLGLATVFGIVKQHQGWIEVQSEVGVGSVFRVFLPARKAPLLAHASALASPLSRGKETILMVEDNKTLREVTVKWLKHIGYQVLEATNGHEAMDLWKQQGGKVDLVLTDMVMPGEISGLELAEKLREINPALKVIISSGYSLELTRRNLLKERGIVCLAKPYEGPTLAAMVRRCLDGA